MIDIVKGLRLSAEIQKAMNIPGSSDAEVAADEIERLRKRISELEAILSREEHERQARLAYYKQALE
jgi:hypothetical protein